MSSSTNDALFSGSADTDSWPVSSDSTVVSWDTQTVNDSTASTAPTSDTRQKAPDNSTHCLERYDAEYDIEKLFISEGRRGFIQRDWRMRWSTVSEICKILHIMKKMAFYVWLVVNWRTLLSFPWVYLCQKSLGCSTAAWKWGCMYIEAGNIPCYQWYIAPIFQIWSVSAGHEEWGGVLWLKLIRNCKKIWVNDDCLAC